MTLEGGKLPDKSTLYANIFSGGLKKIDNAVYKTLIIRGGSNKLNVEEFAKETKKEISRVIDIIYKKLGENPKEKIVPYYNLTKKDLLKGMDWYDMPTYRVSPLMKEIPTIEVKVEMPFNDKVKPDVSREAKKVKDKLAMRKEDIVVKISKSSQQKENTFKAFISYLKEKLPVYTGDEEEEEEEKGGGNGDDDVDATIKSTSSSWWVPVRPDGLKSFNMVYIDGKTKNTPKYPIYVISHERSMYRSTMRYLDACKLKYYVVVRKNQEKSYKEVLNPSYSTLLTLPEKGDKDYKELYGLYPNGGIPQRNYVWNHSRKLKSERHWILDDNMPNYYRWIDNKRIKIYSGDVFKSIEDYVDRYTNIRIAGHQYSSFLPTTLMTKNPLTKNTRVFSSILLWNKDTDEMYNVDNDEKMRFKKLEKDVDSDALYKYMDDNKKNNIKKELSQFSKSRPLYQWEGSYNEDVDLSVRILKSGYASALFNFYNVNKLRSGVQDGGNIANVYKDPNSDKYKAYSLMDKHPDIVKIVYRYKRYHHEADLSKFDIPFVWKANQEKKYEKKEDNNHGLQLVNVMNKEVSPAIIDNFGNIHGKKLPLNTANSEVMFIKTFKKLAEKYEDFPPDKISKLDKKKYLLAFDTLKKSWDYYNYENENVKKTFEYFEGLV
jgi:hypothetical protein